MTESEKKTVGKAAYDLLQKDPEKINVIDMQREMQKSVMKELDEIIARHGDYAEKYYIVYMLQRERIMQNAIRQKFIVRRTRPSPDYDCTLFSYDNRTGQLSYHWTIPDEDSCRYLLANKANLSKEEKQLISYVERFSDGTLE